jgi:hypothetical protein
VPSQRLLRADLAAPFHGTRLPAHEHPDLTHRCAAYATMMRPGWFFSHATAAALYGLPLPSRFADEPLHVSAVLPVRAPKGKGVRGHSLAVAPPIHLREGLPVPEPTEVWCELAAMLTVEELVIVGDALLRRKQPLCDRTQLVEAAADAVARPGVRRLREAVALVRARTDSPMETALRIEIVRAGMPEPEVNYAIADRSGRIVASGDMVFPHAHLVVEYDGDHHRRDADQYQTDIDRIYLIEDLGWRVVRINKEHMRFGAAEALRRVRAALRTSGPNTPLSRGE